MPVQQSRSTRFCVRLFCTLIAKLSHSASDVSRDFKAYINNEINDPKNYIIQRNIKVNICYYCCVLNKRFFESSFVFFNRWIGDDTTPREPETLTIVTLSSEMNIRHTNNSSNNTARLNTLTNVCLWSLFVWIKKKKKKTKQKRETFPRVCNRII